MSEEGFTLQRISELAQRSYNNSQYTFTDFLSMAEISDFYSKEKDFLYASPKLFGGCDIAERKMIRFGNEEEFGYIEEFPIVAIRVKPLMDKFSDSLTHRDFLGALMNLGIKRETMGDIFVKNNEACIFCKESISEYITENLTRVKHTSVRAEIAKDIQDITSPTLEEKIIQVSGERIDAVTSKVYNISRQEALELFSKGLVYLNGRSCSENAKLLKAKDLISVRGMGRYEFCEVTGISKKGKQNCRIMIYK